MDTKETTQTLEPYILAPEGVLEQYPDTHEGEEITKIDSYGDHGGAMTEMLLEVDAAAYDEDLPVENWISVDCMQQTSGIIGYASEDPEDWPEAVDVPDDHDGPVPVSEFAGGYQPDGTLVVNTFSTATKEEGIGTKTAELAAEVFPADAWEAVSQYDNISPKVYSGLGAMELEEATVPGHSLPDKSFLFSVDLTAEPYEGDPEDWLTVGADEAPELQDGLADTDYTIPEPGAVVEDEEVKLVLEPADGGGPP